MTTPVCYRWGNHDGQCDTRQSFHSLCFAQAPVLVWFRNHKVLQTSFISIASCLVNVSAVSFKSFFFFNIISKSLYLLSFFQKSLMSRIFMLLNAFVLICMILFCIYASVLLCKLKLLWMLEHSFSGILSPRSRCG